MAVLPLEENLRNTSQIAALLNPLAEEKMRYRGGDGPPVLFVPCPAADVFDAADAQVDRLLAAGHAAGQIAVLTTGHRHPNHKYVEQLGGKQALWDGYWMDDEVFYATVMGFKGLERPIVVLAVDYFHADVSRDVMYAGMSRARDQLVVCGDLEMIRAAVGDEVCRRLAG
jgi:superfamily I DNA/RNA helicase